MQMVFHKRQGEAPGACTIFATAVANLVGQTFFLGIEDLCRNMSESESRCNPHWEMYDWVIVVSHPPVLANSSSELPHKLIVAGARRTKGDYRIHFNSDILEVNSANVSQSTSQRMSSDVNLCTWICRLQELKCSQKLFSESVIGVYEASADLTVLCGTSGSVHQFNRGKITLPVFERCTDCSAKRHNDDIGLLLISNVHPTVSFRVFNKRHIH